MWQVGSVVACPMCFRVVLSKVIKLYRHRPSVAASPPPSLLAQLVFEMTYYSNIVHQMHFALFYRLLVAGQLDAWKNCWRARSVWKESYPWLFSKQKSTRILFGNLSVYCLEVGSKNRRVRDELKQVISKLKKCIPLTSRQICIASVDSHCTKWVKGSGKIYGEVEGCLFRRAEKAGRWERE